MQGEMCLWKIRGKCDATGFKECSSCHSILKSQCGMQKCRSESGMKLEMILPAEGKKNPAKEKLYFSSTEEDSISESETGDEDSVNNGNEIEVDLCDMIESSWRSLCPPHLQTDVEGKWYAVIWLGKKTKSLFIGKVLRRFLVHKDGMLKNLK